MAIASPALKSGRICVKRVGEAIMPVPKAVEPPPAATEPPAKAWRLPIDPAKATETIYWAGEGVEALPKWFPEVGREMAAGGEIIDVLAILVGGAGSMTRSRRATGSRWSASR